MSDRGVFWFVWLVCVIIGGIIVFVSRWAEKRKKAYEELIKQISGKLQGLFVRCKVDGVEAVCVADDFHKAMDKTYKDTPWKIQRVVVNPLFVFSDNVYNQLVCASASELLSIKEQVIKKIKEKYPVINEALWWRSDLKNISVEDKRLFVPYTTNDNEERKKQYDIFGETDAEKAKDYFFAYLEKKFSEIN